MRFLMKVRMPVEKGNSLVKDPTFAKKMEALLNEVKPEAAYFALDGGQRCMYLFVHANSNDELPSKVEPFWLALNADVEVTPAMNAEDLAKAGSGLAAIVKKWG